jgi:hypothetical protein
VEGVVEEEEAASRCLCGMPRFESVAVLSWLTTAVTERRVGLAASWESARRGSLEHKDQNVRSNVSRIARPSGAEEDLEEARAATEHGAGKAVAARVARLSRFTREASRSSPAMKRRRSRSALPARAVETALRDKLEKSARNNRAVERSTFVPRSRSR